MSVLEKMGVQVWRLRGRRASAAAAAKDPVEVDKNQTFPSTESNEIAPQISSPVGQISEASLDTRQALLSSVDAESATKQRDAPQDSPTALNDTAKTEAESQELASSEESKTPAQSAPSIKPAPIPESKTSATSADVRDSQKPSNSVPKLRPAPVPLEPENAIDLTITAPISVDVTADISSNDGQAGSDHIQINEEINSLDNAYSEYEQQANSTPGLSVTGMGESRVQVDETVGSSPPSMDWRSLQATISNSEDCPSCGPSQSTLGFGDVLADWMFICDAPTTSDLEVQQLLVGRAGQLYGNILAACGLTRAQVYSSTIFKCTAPEDISITPQCDRLIHTQISLVKPKCIVVFGEFATQAILQSNEPFGGLLKGRHYYPGSGCLVIPAYTPQELLANPKLKAKLWSSLKLAIKELA